MDFFVIFLIGELSDHNNPLKLWCVEIGHLSRVIQNKQGAADHQISSQLLLTVVSVSSTGFTIPIMNKP